MENSLEEKYRRLATEYSKLRAQANVLKRAVLDEQNKNSTLRDNIRSKESSLRRAEQEVDSLGFRNKQLESRVATLQEDLKKMEKNPKSKTKPNGDEMPYQNETVLFNEDLQKKIFENFQLESLVSDKTIELELKTVRIEELEASIAKLSAERADQDGKMRREIERLAAKNHDLEAKLVEASSIVGSDDTLYVSSECEQHHNSAVSGEDRTKILEKEIVFWRTQYELLKIGLKVQDNVAEMENKKIELSTDNSVGNKETKTPTPKDINKDQLLYQHFTTKIEELFTQKCVAESKLSIYNDECEALQKHLEILTLELKAQEEKFMEKQRDLRIADEDMATIRINYEEQIAVLTEQVINLSDQLAALK